MIRQVHSLIPYRLRPAFGLSLLAGALILASVHSVHADDIETDSGATVVEHDDSVFQPDPTYEDSGYDSEAQLQIYGGKSAFPTPRPPRASWIWAAPSTTGRLLLLARVVARCEHSARVR